MTVPLESCFAENSRKGGGGVRIEWMVKGSMGREFSNPLSTLLLNKI